MDSFRQVLKFKYEVWVLLAELHGNVPYAATNVIDNRALWPMENLECPEVLCLCTT